MSGVLPNRLGITDPGELQAIERRVTALRVQQVAAEPDRFGGDFSFEHLRQIHAHILGDVYAWAGQVRTEDTGAMGMPHCRKEYLPEQITYVFRQINAALPLSSDVDHALSAVADMWGETTALHPFLDGNSRSQTVFFDLMLATHGHAVDWSRVDAAAVHAARHVAMRTADSRYLAAELRPGVTTSVPAGTVTALRDRDNVRAVDLHRDMLMHKQSQSGTADQYRQERDRDDTPAPSPTDGDATADRAAHIRALVDATAPPPDPSAAKVFPTTPAPYTGYRRPPGAAEERDIER